MNMEYHLECSFMSDTITCALKAMISTGTLSSALQSNSAHSEPVFQI